MWEDPSPDPSSDKNCICMKRSCANAGSVFLKICAKTERVVHALLWMFNFSGFYEQNSRRRQIANINRASESGEIGTVYEDPNNEARNNQWRRILLLVVAITVHFFKIVNNCFRIVRLDVEPFVYRFVLSVDMIIMLLDFYPIRYIIFPRVSRSA